MALNIVFQEIQRIKEEENFHTTGEIYKILSDLQEFILHLKTKYELNDL